MVDLAEGTAAKPVVARDGKETFEIGSRLFPGCRLAGVVREEAVAGEEEDK